MSHSIFPLGVASGDPGPHAVTLWTRLAPAHADPATADPATAHPVTANPAGWPVAWRIAADPGMRGVVAAGTAQARAADDWTVTVRVDDPALRPFTTYWYQFTAFGRASRVGRCRTLPDPTRPLDRLRLAYVSCQDHTAGHFTALAKVADADVDYVLHLGDAIYETVGDPTFQRRGPGSRALRLPGGRIRAETLEDYRWLYRTYRRDPDLQHLYAQHTVLPIWDDHEFANDGYGVHDTDTADEAVNADPARRSAASRAWVEYQPVDIAFDPDAEPVDQLRIYRAFPFGDLAELVMTDERLYRDGPPCGLEPRHRYATHGCPEAAAPERTMLGATQRRWLVDRVTSSTRRWTLWANETMVMPFRLPGWLARLAHPEAGAVPMTDTVYLNLDQWDGYQWERELLADAFADTDGLVVLTGDLHSFVAGTWRAGSGRAVAPCLMVGSVTSANLVELLAGRTLPSLPLPLRWLLRWSNPHLSFVNSSAHGYNVLEITPDQVRCTMRAVSGVRRRGGWAWPLGTVTVRHGDRSPRR